MQEPPAPLTGRVSPIIEEPRYESPSHNTYEPVPPPPDEYDEYEAP